MLGKNDGMIIKVNKNAIIQYAILYLVYILNDSYLYKYFLGKYNIILFFAGLFCILIKKIHLKYAFAYLIYSFATILFVRNYADGVGLQAFLRVAVPLIFVVIAIQINKQQFLDRWVKLIVVMAGISLICWGIVQINADILRNYMIMRFDAGKVVDYWISSTNAAYRTVTVDGALLYTIRGNFELDRNNGVFSEPGLFQMMLCASLFILLFLDDMITVKGKKRMYYSMILLLTIVTCKSTSGYLSTIILLIVFFLNRRKNDNTKKHIVAIAVLVISFIVGEYLWNGNSSVLYTQFLRKIIMDGKISITADTGVWRIMTINTMCKSMIEHPLGIGYDNAIKLMPTGSSGAQIFVFGAAMGIIPFIVIQIWMLYPVFRTSLINRSEKVAYLFMFYNSMLAQSKEVYAVYLVFTILFIIDVVNHGNKKMEDTELGMV